ncbi:MAG: hypothetical protein ACJ8FY_05450 [Gemmataceae bacterium]
MDKADDDLADILADCASDDDLERQIIKHARIVQRLACCMVRGLDDAEARIRTLYSDFADMAVEHIADSRVFPGRTLH